MNVIRKKEQRLGDNEMNVNRRRQACLLLLVVLLVGLLVAVSGGEAVAKGFRHGPRAFPPTRAWYGHTYEEWGAKFFQWAASVPDDGNHPLKVAGQMDCSRGQEGDVWFLGGIYGGSGQLTRECTIPEGKALFFPIVNIICSPFTDDFPEVLLACAANPGDVYEFGFHMYPVKATVDGKPIGGLERFYTLSKETFDLGPLPYPNIFDDPLDAVAPGATGGYYLLMPPLPEGEHVIYFNGGYDLDFDFDGTADYTSTQEITYILEVENGD